MKNILGFCAVLLCSCTIYEMPSSSSSGAAESSSSADDSTKFCIYEDSSEYGCTSISKDKKKCPGNGILVDRCPYSSSSSN